MICAGTEERKLNQRKKAIEVELSSVQPLVDAAKAAVGGISQESLSYIRSLKAPPDTIRVILMVCVSMRIMTSWFPRLFILS